jgi:hypothetical protein
MVQGKLSDLNVPAASRFEVFKSRLSQAQGKKESVKAIEKLCRAENKALRKQFESLTTIRRYYTFYRNICREVISKEALDISLKIFNLSIDETKSLNGQYAQKVAHEHRNLRPLKHYEKMIVKASELLEAPSLYDRILGLTFLTGRRSAEIACTALFQPLEKDSVLFEGQLKGKTRVMDIYKIPVLGEPDALIHATKRVREQRPQWVDQPLLFHACGSKELSRRVKRHFSEFMDDPAVKDLRAAYAEVCYHRFGSEKITKSRFFSDILGHGEDDNLTGQSYLDFYLQKEEEE